MEFSPNNNIVRLCIQGMTMEDQGKAEDASKVFLQAWNEATSDFEKYLAAFYVARQQADLSDKLNWYEAALQFVLKVDDEAARSGLHGLYTKIAECYEHLNDVENAQRNRDFAKSANSVLADAGPFYHGTRADLKVGDLLTPGGNSNYQADLVMNHIYFTALANGAGLAAALAKGDAPERVYVVEPTGSFENDPNVTDKKFPGNPTRSYRSSEPLKIVGELTEWLGQTPEQLQHWRDRLAKGEGKIIN